MTVAAPALIRQVAVPEFQIRGQRGAVSANLRFGTPEIHDSSAVLAQTCLGELAEGTGAVPRRKTRTFKVSETMT
jgi:hypothetical protein